MLILQPWTYLLAVWNWHNLLRVDWFRRKNDGCLRRGDRNRHEMATSALYKRVSGLVNRRMIHGFLSRVHSKAANFNHACGSHPTHPSTEHNNLYKHLVNRASKQQPSAMVTSWSQWHAAKPTYAYSIEKHPRVLRSKLREKILNFILQNCQKQTVPHESTAQ